MHARIVRAGSADPTLIILDVVMSAPTLLRFKEAKVGRRCLPIAPVGHAWSLSTTTIATRTAIFIRQPYAMYRIVAGDNHPGELLVIC
jgi:hypothetical protein